MRSSRRLAFIAVIALAGLAAWGEARALKLASWNLEHLADTDREGCKLRKHADYQLLRQYAESLAADVVAVQEVENEQALARVFDPEIWSIEISRRADQMPVVECRDAPGQTLITQRTGFAIKKGLRYTRNPDVSELDVAGDNSLRYGVDVTIDVGVPLRLLSVHLKSGCASDPADSGRDECTLLFRQQKVLRAWVAERAQDEIPFIILGDFNRRLQNEDDFWTGLDDPTHPARDLVLSVNRDAISPCRKAFPQFIDYIIFNSESSKLLEPGSFGVLVFKGDEKDFPSDHCPIFIELDAADLKLQEPERGQISPGLKWYRRSAEFPLIARFIYEQAARRVDAIRSEKSGAGDWVVSLDADETVLDNSQGQLENEYLGLGYVSARWKRWEARGAADEVPGAISFMNHVLRSGGKVAVITNRESEFQEMTRANLVRLGLEDDRRKVCILGRSELDLRTNNPDEWTRYGYKNDKDRRRRLLRDGNAAGCWSLDRDGSVKASWSRKHEFVLWVGDNILDLPSITQHEARLHGTPGLAFGKDYFLLPNPLYGSWRDNKP